MRPYQYNRLNGEENEIRLLTLQPGKFQSPVFVNLETVRFTETAIPEFEALSYALGRADDSIDIVVQKSLSIRSRKTFSSAGTLKVTRSLAEALPYLRDEEKPRKLWIDQITVNQQDLEERSSQVKRMAETFRLASRVVVWLGPESSDSNVAVDCVLEISSKVRVTGFAEMEATTSDRSWEDLETKLPFDLRSISALYDFLSRPWFERLWIWQEVHAASSIVAVCGPRLIPWNELRAAIVCILLKRPLVSIKQHDKLRMALHICCMSSVFLNWHAFRETQACKCSDPRDRVFAVLSLLSDDDRKAMIEPDYTKSVAEVYERTVR